MLNPKATSSLSLRRKKQADSGQASGVRLSLFSGFTSLAPIPPPPPPPTGNMLFSLKQALGAAPTPPLIGNLFGLKPALGAAPAPPLTGNLFGPN
jgi:hypothetical protein